MRFEEWYQVAYLCLAGSRDPVLQSAAGQPRTDPVAGGEEVV